MNKKTLIKGIYIHIPFCLQKCFYCDFSSFANLGENIKRKYVEKLCCEINKAKGKYDIDENATIYFGGGTPSVLETSDIFSIVKTLKDNKIWLNPKEANIEVNPGTVDLGKLRALKEMGFDRLSIGVQSLNDIELKAIGRIHSANQAIEAIRSANRAGFKRINVDLMYGLPSQTLRSYENTLDMIAKENVQHISAYSLILEDNTILYDLVNSKKVSLPTDEDVEKMYDLTIDKLKKIGFERYEISNFSLENEQSRHNLVYWDYFPYVAFGLAACSSLQGCRITNACNMKDYLDGKDPENEILDLRTQFEEFMIMGLRKVDGVNLDTVKKLYKVDVLDEFGKEIDRYIKQRFLKYNPATKQLSLTREGMKFGNMIFEIFL